MNTTPVVHGAPDVFSLFSRVVIAPLWAAKERSPYLEHLRALTGSPYRLASDVRADQLTRLQRLLHHAATKSRFYSARFKKAGIDPGDIRTLDDLSILPLTTKDDIRDNRLDMLTVDPASPGLVTMTTSGSTGVSLKLHMDEASQQWKRACAIRHDMWAGWRMGESVGAAWGNPDCRKNWRMWLRNKLLSRHIPLDTLRMDDSSMRRFHDDILKRRPTLLFGHAHSLYLFARFVQQNELMPFRPKGIVSTAMVLHDFERRTIEEVFQAKVFNRYGCEEASLIASECETHEGLHVNCDTLVVEIVDAHGKQVPAGTPGAVVVTDLTNMAMPLIRYKVGDMAVMGAAPCTCGRTYPLLSSLAGRIADYVRTPSGEYISGISLTENFAMKLPGVKQLQIVQESVNRIIFRIVSSDQTHNCSFDELPNLVNDIFGPSMTFDIEHTHSIQSESSGKYRFCISKLHDFPC